MVLLESIGGEKCDSTGDRGVIRAVVVLFMRTQISLSLSGFLQVCVVWVVAIWLLDSDGGDGLEVFV